MSSLDNFSGALRYSFSSFSQGRLCLSKFYNTQEYNFSKKYFVFCIGCEILVLSIGTILGGISSARKPELYLTPGAAGVLKRAHEMAGSASGEGLIESRHLVAAIAEARSSLAGWILVSQQVDTDGLAAALVG